MKISFDKPSDELLAVAKKHSKGSLNYNYSSIAHRDVNENEKLFISDFFIKSYRINNFKDSLSELAYDSRFICFKSIDNNPLGEIFGYINFRSVNNTYSFHDSVFSFGGTFPKFLSIVDSITNGAIAELPDNDYNASVIDIDYITSRVFGLITGGYLLLKSDIEEFLVQYSFFCDFKLHSIDLLRT